MSTHAAGKVLGLRSVLPLAACLLLAVRNSVALAMTWEEAKPMFYNFKPYSDECVQIAFNNHRSANKESRDIVLKIVQEVQEVLNDKDSIITYIDKIETESWNRAELSVPGTRHFVIEILKTYTRFLKKKAFHELHGAGDLEEDHSNPVEDDSNTMKDDLNLVGEYWEDWHPVKDDWDIVEALKSLPGLPTVTCEPVEEDLKKMPATYLDYYIDYMYYTVNQNKISPTSFAEITYLIIKKTISDEDSMFDFIKNLPKKSEAMILEKLDKDVIAGVNVFIKKYVGILKQRMEKMIAEKKFIRRLLNEDTPEDPTGPEQKKQRIIER